MRMTTISRLLAMLGLALIMAAPLAVTAQTTPAPADATTAPASSEVPPSTNPANHVVYPSKGQSADQQMKDQLDSYNWADQQTGWDPYKAHEKLTQQEGAAGQTAQQAQGQGVQGAARGALAGLAIGAIAGDAGMGAAIGATAGGLTGGARSRRQMEAAQSQANQATQEFNTKFAEWDKYWVASMQGRGYSIQ